MKRAVTFALERLGAAEIERLWSDLEPRADINFFLSWHWIGTWIDLAGPPELTLIGRSDGEIVCLGLLRPSLQRRHGFVRSRTLHLHATGDPDQDVIFIEYNGFLTDRRFGSLTAEAVTFLRSAGGFDEVQLGGIIDAEYERLRAEKFRLHVKSRKPSAVVELDSIRQRGGDYLAGLSANTRQQIRRAERIYEDRGPLTLTAAATVAEAKRFFDEMGTLHERSWSARGPGGAWRYPFLVDFHRRLIERAFPEQGIEIVRIACGEAPVGYLYCLKHRGWVGSYLSGFAYEADNKVRPGLVSFRLYIQHLLRGDAEVFDFLAGDERYKMQLGQPGATMYWLSVQEARPQLLLENALRRAKRLLGR